MSKLLRFLAGKQSLLIFVFLELISLVLIINTHNYAQLKTHDFQTGLAGNINQRLNTINRYFYLQNYNDSLLHQNTRLLNKLNQPQNKLDKNGALAYQFSFIPAYAISNQYNLDHNTILINKGSQDSIRPESGVISTHGIVGVIQKTSAHFAKVISILNKSSKINVALIHTNYTGFLQWRHQNPNQFEITDMPTNARIKIGDTIITSGMSSIFPKGIPIGTITGFKTLAGRKSYVIKLKSFMDYTNIGPVYVIKNNLKTEIDSLNMQP